MLIFLLVTTFLNITTFKWFVTCGIIIIQIIKVDFAWLLDENTYNETSVERLVKVSDSRKVSLFDDNTSVSKAGKYLALRSVSGIYCSKLEPKFLIKKKKILQP